MKNAKANQKTTKTTAPKMTTGKATKVATPKIPKGNVTMVNRMPQYTRQVDAIGELVDVSPTGKGQVLRFSPAIGQRFQFQKDGKEYQLFKFSLSSRKLRYVENVASVDATVKAIKRGKYRDTFSM